jgi:dihydroneopterin aldolase
MRRASEELVEKTRPDVAHGVLTDPRGLPQPFEISLDAVVSHSGILSQKRGA